MKHPGSGILIALLAPILVAHALGGEEVPIKGRCEGSMTLTPVAGSDSALAVGYVATGTTSHLGRVEMTTVTPEVELDLENGIVIVRSREWSGTVTTASGDTIFGRYAVRDDIIPFTPAGDFSAGTDLTVTGGTGRFEGATGRVLAIIKGNVFDLTFGMEFEGKISAVGSSKR